MGQYRPSGLIPSTLTSNYTIDATVANDFRCRINGTSPTTKYQLKIMKNDAASTAVYDSGIVTLAAPLYPVNYDGTPNELVVSVPSNSGMENGNEYKWTMTSYWSDNDKYESYENVFKAYAAASVTISNLPETVASRSYTFVATVTQAQGVAVQRFGWIIRNKDTLEETVNTIDENNIYSSDVRLTYDGFLSGTTEEIRVKCWMNDGTEVETQFQSFDVSYQLVAFENLVVAEPQEDSGVLVKWNKLTYINGTSTGSNISYVDGDDEYSGTFLRLGYNSSVKYDNVTGAPMNFPMTCSHTISFRLHGANGSVYKATGVDSNGRSCYLNVTATGSSVIVDVNGTRYAVMPTTPGTGWITLTISPTEIKGFYWEEIDPLYPKDELFPDPALYPRYVVDLLPISTTDIGIDSNGFWKMIEISGIADFRYIWIKENALTQAEYDSLYIYGATAKYAEQEAYLKNLIATGDYGQRLWAEEQLKTLQSKASSYDVDAVPVWDDTTLMLALFQNNLRAGNIESAVPVTGWIIYSVEDGSSFLKPIRTVGAGTNTFVDYSVKNATGVVYYVFPVFGDKIGAAASSNRIIPDWWDWFLIVCDRIDDDTYYQLKTYRFDLDVSSGSMANNTSFNELQNFTKYAKVQNSFSNYWSGTLSSYIGNCANTYEDTVAQMEELKSLSTDGKDKFLKDRKGNFWKVRLNSAVSQKINDEYVEQAVVVTLGWMEIGDASNSVVTNLL